jgi:hypothetical protein
MTWDRVNELLDAGQDAHAIELAHNLAASLQRHTDAPRFTRLPNYRDIEVLDRVKAALIRKVLS